MKFGFRRMVRAADLVAIALERKILARFFLKGFGIDFEVTFDDHPVALFGKTTFVLKYFLILEPLNDVGVGHVDAGSLGGTHEKNPLPRQRFEIDGPAEPSRIDAREHFQLPPHRFKIADKFLNLDLLPIDRAGRAAQRGRILGNAEEHEARNDQDSQADEEGALNGFVT